MVPQEGDGVLRDSLAIAIEDDAAEGLDVSRACGTQSGTRLALTKGPPWKLAQRFGVDDKNPYPNLPYGEEPGEPSWVPELGLGVLGTAAVRLWRKLGHCAYSPKHSKRAAAMRHGVLRLWKQH